MKIARLGFVLTLFTSSVLARPVTVDDLMRLRTVSDVRISPDGERVAYVVSTPSLEGNAFDPVLYVVPAEGGTPLRLTYRARIANRPVPIPNLKWSPSGQEISFLALSDEIPQVFAMGASGGEARPLTTAKEGASQYEWSPDGTRIAYLSSEPQSAEEDRSRKDKSYVIEVGRGNRPARIWMQDVAGGAPRALTPLDHFVSGLDWTPDGSRIVYSAAPAPDYFSQFHSKIYSIPASGGPPQVLVDRDGMNARPQVSPDGRSVAFVSTDGRAEMVSIWGLHVVGTSGGPIKNLSAQTGSWIGEFCWEPDSTSLLYIPNEGTGQRGEHMFEQPIFRVSLDGRTRSLTPGPFVHYALSLSRDGKRLAYRKVEPRTMGEVEVMTLADGQTRALTDVNPEIRELTLGEMKAIHWKSFDGMEIWGLLLTPPGHTPGRPPTMRPLVVYAHGGPIGGFTYGIFPQFMHRPGQVDPYPAEAMASAGMAVLFPMPRGGSGYGLEGFRMILDSWGDGDYRDIMAGVDHVIAQGIADPERLGIMGASYGGFMTNWIVTQTGRFRAASSGASVADLEDLYYLSDAGEFTNEYFGLPWKKAESYRAHSPLTHAERVTTPLLIQHGENDRRVPMSQARKFYEALKRMGKTVEMEIYPRGGHVNYEPVLEREIMSRNLAWFEKWLLPVRPQKTVERPD